MISDLYSDNGSNIVGANNKVKPSSKIFNSKINGNKIINHLGNNNIRWHFILLKSPNFGRIWESLVKLIKNYLKGVLGEAQLSYELFYTTLTQIEYVINSRSLSPISDDPNDFAALTPRTKITYIVVAYIQMQL